MARYSETDIQSLKYPENIQRRPGMYVGGTGVQALHHLAFEVIDNAVDEAMAGACTQIKVSLNADGSLTVIDNGRGIPAGLHPGKKKSTLELVFTELHTGGKFGGGGYATSGGLHGVGVKATNALSVWLEVEIHRDGVVYKQRYECGLPSGPVTIHTEAGKKLGEVKPGSKRPKPKGKKKGGDTGTTVAFKPNPEFLETVEFDFDTLAHRLQNIAFQIPALTIEIADRRGKKVEKRRYHYKGGLSEWVAYLNAGKPLLHKKPLHLREVVEVSLSNGQAARVEVALALQYHADTNDPEGIIISTVNTIPTPEGGKHVSGFRAGLTKALNTFAAKKRLVKNGGGSIGGKDILYGLTAVLKVLMPEPQFTSQTKTQLATDYIQGVVQSVVYGGLLEAFRKNISLGRSVVKQAQAAAQARQAEAKVRASIMRKSILEVNNLPGKLADCDSRTHPLLTTLYIVEGDSAGGSCKLARNRRYQAILPLRGKVMNVWRVKLNKAMDNKEVSSIISAIGGGVGTNFSLGDMRYGAIAIMVDADVDGGHIGALLLTLGFKFMRAMVLTGRLFWAVAPLYQIKTGAEKLYAYSDAERDRLALKLNGKKGQKLSIQRYKGLGEMNPEQLRETVFAIDPDRLAQAKEAVEKYEVNRAAYGNGNGNGDDAPIFHPVPLNPHLVRVTLEDIHTAQEAVELLMGKAVEPRKIWLIEQMGTE